MRYLRLKDSPEYRALLSEGWGLELPTDVLERVVEVRRRLQSHEERG